MSNTTYDSLEDWLIDGVKCPYDPRFAIIQRDEEHGHTYRTVAHTSLDALMAAYDMYELRYETQVNPRGVGWFGSAPDGSEWTGLVGVYEGVVVVPRDHMSRLHEKKEVHG